MAQAESKLSRSIMAHLRANDIWCFKIHGGPTMMAGLPDIIACVPLLKHYDDGFYGQFVGFETKMPGGVVSPIQLRVHENIGQAAGIVFVVRSLEDVTDALNYLGWVRPDIDEPLNLNKASLWQGWKTKSERRLKPGKGRG